MLKPGDPEFEAARAKKRDTAKSSFSLTNGTSPFVDGAKFTITGYDYEPINPNDSESNLYAVFTTTIGPISVASLTKAIVIKPYTDPQTGEFVTTRRPDGTFNNFLRQFFAQHRGKTNDEVLPLAVEACKDKKLVVRKREYAAVESKYGDRPKPLCHVDIIGD